MSKTKAKKPATQPATPKAPARFYMVQGDGALLFYVWSDRDLGYNLLGRAKLGAYAADIYEAAKSKRLSFYV